MLVTIEHQVAEDFVREHNDTVFLGQMYQRLGDLGAHGKVHVGDPQRVQIVASVILFEYFNLLALRAMAVNATAKVKNSRCLEMI